MLVFAWALSGPGVAAVLSGLAAIVTLYLALGAKEPAFFLQVLIFAGLFVFMAFYLQAIQQRYKDKQIAREKLAEDLHLTRKEIEKKTALKGALRRKIDRFLDLERFSEQLKEAQGLEAAAKLIVEESCRVLEKADECVLYLVDEDKQELSLTSTAPAARGRMEKAGRVFDQWVMKRSQAVMIEDTRDDFRFTSEAKPDLDDWRSVCASPLVVENKVLGVIRANSLKPRCFSADDLRLLDVFAGFGAVTLRNILLYRTAEELATRDGLTGLYVKRHFEERLAELVRAAEAASAPFCVVLLDIDHFKRYNDEYGHSAGDLVLKNVGGIVSDACGPRDTAARYGGEEFVVLLAGRPKGSGLEAAEKLRQEIEKAVFVLRRAERHVTASFGVASFPEDGRTPQDLLWAADKNLYEAKHSGRNRVCGATSS